MSAAAGAVMVMVAVFASGETFAAVVVEIFVVHWFSE
jgi:hypothetical protein